jgi:hypothetical protein
MCMSLPPKRLDPEKDQRRAAEHAGEREARQPLPGRQAGELRFDEFEIVADRVQIAAGLIDLTQCERVFVWHTHVMSEKNCPIVIRSWLRRRASAKFLADAFERPFQVRQRRFGDFRVEIKRSEKIGIFSIPH